MKENSRHQLLIELRCLSVGVRFALTCFNVCVSRSDNIGMIKRVMGTGGLKWGKYSRLSENIENKTLMTPEI